MKKFVFKIVILFFPLLLILSIVSYIGNVFVLQTGELMDVDEMIMRQQLESDTLIGLAYSGPEKYLKLKTAVEVEAEVITLGTSRVMQFSERYFNASFYNTGGGVSLNFDEYLNFLMNIEKEYHPRVIILGLDSWIFNAEWRKQYDTYNEFTPIIEKDVEVKYTIASLLSDYFSGKWSLNNLYKSKHIGMNAIENGNGFRSDGSYRYNQIIRNYEQTNALEHLEAKERIKKGIDRFEYGAIVSKEALSELDDLLRYCDEMNIMVVAFIPPFAPSIYEEMKSSNKYQYAWDIYNKCLPLFEQYEYELFDMQDILFLGVHDGSFIDGFHGSDVVYALMCQYMIEEGSILGQYIDGSQLESLIRKRHSNLELEYLY